MLRTVFYSTLDIDSKKASQGVSKLIRYGDVLNIIQADERNRIVERNEVPLFENDTFREAVINAFVHNKWISGNEPMITVFLIELKYYLVVHLRLSRQWKDFLQGIYTG